MSSLLPHRRAVAAKSGPQRRLHNSRTYLVSLRQWRPSQNRESHRQTFWLSGSVRPDMEPKTDSTNSHDDDTLPLLQRSQNVAVAADSWRPLLLAIFAAAGIAAVLWSADVSELVQSVEDAVTSSGPFAPLIFIGAYAAATVLLFPASLLTLLAGALFGPFKGTIVVSAASTLGACLAFLLARYVAGPWVEGRLQGNPKLQAVVSEVSSQGLRLVFLLRLSPLFPFNLLNYALGLTQIGFLEYAVSSWAGMLPGTIAYVALGGAGKATLDAVGDGGSDLPKLLLYGVGALATVVATKIASDAASKALKEAQDGGQSQ